jgi:hypothetical protein
LAGVIFRRNIPCHGPFDIAEKFGTDWSEGYAAKSLEELSHQQKANVLWTGDEKTDTIAMNIGLPQGNMLDLLRSGGLKLFADDCVILNPSKSVVDAIWETKEDFDVLADYNYLNKITLIAPKQNMLYSVQSTRSPKRTNNRQFRLHQLKEPRTLNILALLQTRI